MIDIQKVRASFMRLIDSARALNEQSDLLSAQMEKIDHALRAMNIGLECRVQMSSTHADTQLWFGYSCHDGKWGLTLWRDAPNDNGVWLFANAPRWLRIEAVDYIPHLFDALLTTTIDTIAQMDITRAKVHVVIAKLDEKS